MSRRNQNNYSTDDIQALEGMEHVRIDINVYR
jgi:DNA gyrase/topoisomerase IV subunit B